MPVEDVIVVIEDDPNIADLLNMYLREAGFRVYLAADGERGLELTVQHRPSLCLIDAGLPGMDGLEVCRQLRVTHPDTAIMMVTARDSELDRVLGLEMGADDYVTKPFSPREVTARAKAILRRTRTGRTEENTPDALVYGPIEVDCSRREATNAGTAVQLTAREYDLLVYLLESTGRALSRQQLLDHVWGSNWYGDERTVDVHVGQLRKKLGNEFHLSTVWGVGYRLEPR